MPAPTTNAGRAQEVHVRFMTELLEFDARPNPALIDLLTTGSVAARLADAPVVGPAQGYVSAILQVQQVRPDRYTVVDCSWVPGAAGGKWSARQRTTVVDRVDDAWKVSGFHTGGPTCDPVGTGEQS